MRISPMLLCGWLAACCMQVAHAQKKPLDHSVYDSWQSISEKQISNNGRYVVYTVSPQEGDANLVIQQADGTRLVEIARGYAAKITNDNGFVICKIKPAFKDTRDARIKKKKPEEMPKDSLAIYNLSTKSLVKVALVKSFKVPEDGSGWLAYLLEKTPATAAEKPVLDSAARIAQLVRMADSLSRAADSLRNKLTQIKTTGFTAIQAKVPAGNKATGKKDDNTVEEGTTLVLKNLVSGEEKKYELVNDYLFDKKATALVVRVTKKNADSTSRALVLWQHLSNNKVDTVMKGFNDARAFALDEAATRLAFVAERDSSAKAVQKYYRLWYYTSGYDSAKLLADRFTKGVLPNWGISENADLTFSKSGNRLFLGTAPILPPKDTTLPEFERAAVDVWNYKDDALQTVQLYNLNKELKKSYLAYWDDANKQVVQLADTAFRLVKPTAEGDGAVFYAENDFGKRIAAQWQGYVLEDVYAINPVTGAKKLIVKDFKGATYPSYTGKYLLLYNDIKRSYSIYNTTTGNTYAVAADVKVPLYDEENDVPDDPNPHGVMRWMEGDKYVFIYDKYDVWKVDPEAKEKSVNITNGRKNALEYRYVNTNEDEKFLTAGQQVLFRLFDDNTKYSGLATLSLTEGVQPVTLWLQPYSFGAAMFSNVQKAKEGTVLLYTKENFTNSPNLYTRSVESDNEKQLSTTNPQQGDYSWGSASLYKWKAYTGKQTEGVLYKPENFDAKKKYPMIVYFYERNNNTLYNYLAPAPTPSRLNISFFVSRGYVVFVPDIWYTNGHPGQSAYDYIVSGTRALIKEGFIDSTKIGLQGQSWGGYQTAYLITRTNLYAAAWAGAPVVNMFSAYGGIRWESGLNRQFQYEHTQSRIGATIWDKPYLYTENSPLFHFAKVKTPLVVMANDADGAVPWYQGIECFTALRRLNKPVWMLNYNGEAHNLVERRNRKDIQVREQQFFDWLLKGEKPAPWITDGVPAVMKGRTWGL
ncbi:Prolyl oligopeptidase family protein [Filimonas lacunae]|uniref:Prolyl oligopeptidase family protein n=1 Tax=Filimonas lacunae TaxID=477680 RepID=A0A173MAV6_9BACT|nr:prolyl oligopeptidase family serine peptidase [Filimonas lacunae]BAV04598.1 acylaminoacyl-peptidase [Filimonas lacunae]SIT32707.1 Prolyl oligopeptidase family protein [Filimonas lacunae]